MTPETASTLLQIPINSPMEDIEKAFRRRARLTHPDRFHGASDSDIASANLAFTQISDAREVLLEEARKRVKDTSAPPTSGPTPPPKKPQRQQSTPKTAQTSTPKMSYEEYVENLGRSQWGPIPPQAEQETSTKTPSQSSAQASQAPFQQTNPTPTATTQPEVKEFGWGTLALIFGVIFAAMIGTGVFK
ncbi:MAG: J domain-containing protein [Microbacteriaceae bacterium]